MAERPATGARAARSGQDRARAVRAEGPWPLALALVLIAAVFLMGGGSRLDIASLPILRPLAVLIGGAALLMEPRWSLRVPLALLGGLALVMVIQLVPLPPGLWTALPGRDIVRRIAPALGEAQPWRAVSLSRDGTVNALFALSVPLATLTVFSRLGPTARGRAALALAVGLGLSGLWGLLQVGGPPGSPLYLYRITIPGSAAGLFANPNHQAVLLACLFPLLAWWARRPEGAGTQGFRLWVAAGVAVLLVPMLIVTGSRAGLALGAAAAVASLAIARAPGAAEHGRSHRRARAPAVPRAALLAGLGVAAAGVAALLWVQRGAIDRIFATTSLGELRATLLPRLADLAWRQFPVGSGFGTFEKLWRIDEPVALLQPAYLNHAHNDLAEFLIEGGLGSLVLLVAAGVLCARAAVAVWLGRGGALQSESASSAALLARSGSVVVAVLAVASLVDYPLRTPTAAMIAAAALAWLLGARDDEGRVGLSRTGRASKPARSDTATAA